MPQAELVFANVVDRRIWESEGEGGIPLLYVLSLPGRALPFVAARYWKAPQGYVTEHFELVAPSGRTAYTSEKKVRRMTGQMDLTQIADLVEDAVLEELGIYAASFLIDGEVQGQIEFQVLVQAPGALPAEVEEALKKTDVIWVGTEANGRDRAVPVWFAYDGGRIYLLHSDDRDSGEQQIPGLPDAPELVVVTRHKYRETRSNRFHAAVRLIEADSPEFDQRAAVLADRRRDRHGPPQDAIKKWKSSCLIAELTPETG
ncbi:MAG TPA: hypothetical protein VG602_03700 [Actinomycetota bacterium]|nr:hypothetical protein [Actinomycetota bacterium]